jgi:hypothetical protein
MMPIHFLSIFPFTVVSTFFFSFAIPPTASWLSNLDPIQAHCFSRDFGIAQATVLQGVSPGRASSGAKA